MNETNDVTGTTGGGVVNTVVQGLQSAENLGILEPPEITQGVVQESPYSPDPRPAYVNGVYNPQYAGGGIVDRNNQLIIGPDGKPYEYNLNTDPTKTFYGMSEQQRTTTQDRLEARGISAQTSSQFINALGFLMESGNNIGRDWETALTKLETMTSLAPKTYAPRYRVTSSTDIRAVADESARRVLGRKFSAEELQRFTESYQQQEIATQQAGAGVSEAAPSVATAAEAFAERVDPSQANAYRFLGFFDQLSSSLRSRI
jgi:hypothetical protein